MSRTSSEILIYILVLWDVRRKAGSEIYPFICLQRFHAVQIFDCYKMTPLMLPLGIFTTNTVRRVASQERILFWLQGRKSKPSCASSDNLLGDQWVIRVEGSIQCWHSNRLIADQNRIPYSEERNIGRGDPQNCSRGYSNARKHNIKLSLYNQLIVILIVHDSHYGRTRRAMADAKTICFANRCH